MRPLVIVGAALSLMLCGEAVARPKPAAAQPQPKQLADMLACRAIADGPQRLACFDQNAGKLATATEQQEIVVVDRQEIREARKSLFGFTMPSLRMFGFGGSGKEDKDDTARLDTTLTSARQDGDGRWILVLADGAVWHQIDDQNLARAPRPGSAIMIRQGAFGSYVLHVDGQLGFKAHRES